MKRFTFAPHGKEISTKKDKNVTVPTVRQPKLQVIEPGLNLHTSQAGRAEPRPHNIAIRKQKSFAVYAGYAAFPGSGRDNVRCN